jgi:putative ABC transport system permease protein
MGKVQPPKWAQRFVEWYCKPQLAEDLIGDLNEYFERNMETIGVRRAKLIYIIDVIKFLRPYTVRVPKFINPLINLIMIGSYMRTSTRNVMRNKLFSAINIIGLAISMSVGLLMIAFVCDLLSYDRFHENGDRIYRVISWRDKNHEEKQVATTSVKAAQLIRENVSGIETSASIHFGFDRDARVGDKIIPINGLWAEPSVFDIFTLPFIDGNPESALSKPNSVVLTEQTAKKLFGDQPALGQVITLDTTAFEVTGVIKDLPKESHLRFDALGSFITLEQISKTDRDFAAWGNTWQNYFYVLLPGSTNVTDIQSKVNAIADAENAINKEADYRTLEIQPLYDIVLGRDLANENGPVIPAALVWAMCGLAAVVVLSACFNYTNLSVARSMRRFKEVGLRKAIGANRSQIRNQFLFEALIISLFALMVSFGLFLWIRGKFLGLDPSLNNMVSLRVTPTVIIAFILFTVVVGTIAGFLPAFFFGKINVINALKDASSVKIFKHVNLRRSLVIVQYTFTLIFITTTFVGYEQYKSVLTFDLGFNTENILNVELQGNNSANLIKGFSEIPEVQGISRSNIVNSVGRNWTIQVKHHTDSLTVARNVVDENYFKLHDYKFVAGQNFISRPANREETTEIVVNEAFVKSLNLGNSAIGEEIILKGRKLRIVGVLKDFHYDTVDSPIEPVVFTIWTNETYGYINLKIQSEDPIATRAKIEDVWKDIDKVHPVKASYYEEAIENAYSGYSFMIRIIGFLSFLAISIASMGLFGMVVFTTETKLKEIGIRKVMGATSGNLMFLLGRGFIMMLGTASLIALPLTYYIFEGLILVNFPFHSPIGLVELFGGAVVVLMIALFMIVIETLKASRTNPAITLRSE